MRQDIETTAGSIFIGIALLVIVALGFVTWRWIVPKPFDRFYIDPADCGWFNPDGTCGALKGPSFIELRNGHIENQLSTSTQK